MPITNPLFLALLALFAALPNFSHAHGDHEDHASLESYVHLMKDIAEFSPDVLSPDEDLSSARTRIGGQTVELNGALWQLVQGWIRVYYHQLQHDCDHCLNVTEEQFVAQAEDVAAKSFWQRKISDPLRRSAGHMAIGTADLGARLGKTAFVAKITSEIAEAILSKTIGGGGVHVACAFIDAMILFGTRNIQTMARVGGLSPTKWAQLAFVSSAARRAERRVQFTVPPVMVSEEELREVDMDGPNRWWGRADEGKRAKFVNKIVNRGKAKVDGKEFLGRRKKRYLLLKARARGHAHYMRGKENIDPLLNQSVLWILEVQESILQKSLIRDPHTAVLSEAKVAAPWLLNNTAPYDEIRQGLAEEFQPEQAQWIESLLREVEVIFNPKVPRSVRYFQANVIESVMARFVDGVFLKVLSEKTEMFGDSWGGIFKASSYHWHAGKYVGYIYEWTDYLRTLSLTKSPQRLAEARYEAMETFLRLMKYMRASEQLAQAENVADLLRFQERNLQDYRQLVSFKPWKEKKQAYSWMPWGRNARCEELHEVHR